MPKWFQIGASSVATLSLLTKKKKNKLLAKWLAET